MSHTLETYEIERLFVDLETYWTDEEREQFKDAPDEWIIQCYADSEVLKYGPNIRKVRKFVDELSDVSSSGYKALTAELQKHHDFLENMSGPKSDFIRITLGDVISIEEVLQNHGYKPCYDAMRNLEELPDHNLLIMTQYSGWFKAIILALQAEKLVKWEPLERHEERYFLDSQLYQDALNIIRNAGYSY